VAVQVSQNPQKGVAELITFYVLRAEARKAFLKAPMFQKFDPAVLDAYVEYGLYEDKNTGEVHLKCNPAWEASEYTEVRTMNEGWELLPTLDDKVGLRWIMGGREDASDL
jgi:hypothetical protein